MAQSVTTDTNYRDYVRDIVSLFEMKSKLLPAVYNPVLENVPITWAANVVVIPYEGNRGKNIAARNGASSIIAFQTSSDISTTLTVTDYADTYPLPWANRSDGMDLVIRRDLAKDMYTTIDSQITGAIVAGFTSSIIGTMPGATASLLTTASINQALISISNAGYENQDPDNPTIILTNAENKFAIKDALLQVFQNKAQDDIAYGGNLGNYAGDYLGIAQVYTYPDAGPTTSSLTITASCHQTFVFKKNAVISVYNEAEAIMDVGPDRSRASDIYTIFMKYACRVIDSNAGHVILVK